MFKIRSAVLTAVLCLAGTALLPAPAAMAGPADPVVVGSGTNPLTAALVQNADGQLALRVSRGGQPILGDTRLGLTTARGDLATGLRYTAAGRPEVASERYHLAGNPREVGAEYRERSFDYRAAGSPETLRVTLRVNDRTVAFRYQVLGEAPRVTAERTEFTIDPATTAWHQKHTAWYEVEPVKSAVSAIPSGDLAFSLLTRSQADRYVMITETGMGPGYPGGILTHPTAGAGRFGVRLADPAVSPVAGEDSVTSNWRTITAGDLNAIGTSTASTDLAPASRIADQSWIRPGKVAWSWLPENDSPKDYERQKDYVDLAARNGWPYALVDEGWGRDWLADLARYAEARGVKLIVWYRWWELDTPQKRASEYQFLTERGIAGIKVDFINMGQGAPEGVGRFRWYHDLAGSAAQAKLLVNFHGSSFPRGLERTWPNVMTYEGIFGAEHVQWEGIQPAHNTVIPFIRNVNGAMDYTPVVLSQPQRRTTAANEFAQGIVFSSPLTHYAEKPEVLDAHPDGLRMINQVPTVWDETRVLAGDPGDSAVIARRSGNRWFVGGLYAGAARTVQLPLDKLTRGASTVDLLTDGATRDSLVWQTSQQPAGATLQIPIKPDGGFAAIVCPQRASGGCEQTVGGIARTSLELSPDRHLLRPGGSATSALTFRNDDQRYAVRVTDVRADAGSGVSAEASLARDTTLQPGQTLGGDVRLRVAPNAAPGRYPVRVTVTYTMTDATGRTRTIPVEEFLTVLVAPPDHTGDVWVSDLEFLDETNGWGPVERDRSNGETGANDGRPITIGGQVHTKGLGVHAPASVAVFAGGCRALTATIGVDDEVSTGSVRFEVLGDGRSLYRSPVLRGSDPGLPIEVPIAGVSLLELRVDNAGDGNGSDHADWGSARLRCG